MFGHVDAIVAHLGFGARPINLFITKTELVGQCGAIAACITYAVFVYSFF